MNSPLKSFEKLWSYLFFGNALVKSKISKNIGVVKVYASVEQRLCQMLTGDLWLVLVDAKDCKVGRYLTNLCNFFVPQKPGKFESPQIDASP